MGRDDKTPPTGTAIPRPRLKPVELGTREIEIVDFTKLPSEPPPQRESPVPPSNPTLQDIYKLIDERLSTKIVERISSMPPPSEKAADKTAEPPRPSLPVRVAKKSPRWLAYLITFIVALGQAIAASSKEEYRGPIVQGVKLIAIAVSEAFAEDPAAPPETTPE